MSKSNTQTWTDSGYLEEDLDQKHSLKGGPKYDTFVKSLSLNNTDSI